MQVYPPWYGSEWESGRGDATGTKLNIPLNPKSTDQDFIDKKAQPELIILQCGTDSLKVSLKSVTIGNLKDLSTSCWSIYRFYSIRVWSIDDLP